MSKILVLQGPPASFKTTFAKKFVSENKHWVIVSRDSIRHSLGDYWIPEREDLVSKIEYDNICSAIDYGWNVIIDATNLNKKTIAKWEALAEAKQCEIEYKSFWIPFHEAIANDQNSDREHPVGYKVIKHFYERYNPELLNEKDWDNRYIKKLDFSKPNAVIVDVDGSLALHQGRNPYDYEKCDTDKPNQPLIEIIKALYLSNIKVIVVSGREDIGNCREKTTNWLTKHLGIPHKLFMRKEGDHRKDADIIEEIYHNEIENNYNILAVFDDRNQTVTRWRDLGLLCNQVYYGDF